MNRPPIATVASSYDCVQDIDFLADSLLKKMDSMPDMIIASYSSLSNSSELSNRLKTLFPDSAIIGASTCRGAITSQGLCSFGKSNVALWALSDKQGSYGVGFSSFADNGDKGSVEKATLQALEIALSKSSRIGELPNLIWMHASPGCEEVIVSTLDEVFEGDVSIVGGSAADESLEAKWTCFAADEIGSSGVAIAVFFSTYEIGTSFQSGYVPTDTQGLVTRSEGRKVHEIDGRPAALVYNEWTNQLVNLNTANLPTNVLGSSTLSPLGLAVGDVSGIPYYSLAHPETYTEDLALTFFCEVAQGQQLTLMSGSTDNIISRPGRVANEAIYNAGADKGDIVGGLVVFCGGCLLAVEPRADEISGYLNDAMLDQPFLGAFTFGEQGCLMGGENRHGNLMISVTVFKH